MAHGAAEMQLLASAAAGAVVARPAIAGWEIVGWEMEPAHREAAIATYRAVVTADLAEWDDIAEALEAEGVPVGALFVESSASDDAKAMTVRADIGELLAGALTLTLDSNRPDELFLQNVPKGSLAKSETGIDVALVLMDPDSSSVELADNERLVLSSAKHTVSDLGNLRRDLVKSVTTEWGVPYVTQQLRILHARLKSEGRYAKPDRIFRFVGQEIGSDRVPVNAVALVDASRALAFESDLAANLTAAGGTKQRFIAVSVSSLATLHEPCLE